MRVVSPASGNGDPPAAPLPVESERATGLGPGNAFVYNAEHRVVVCRTCRSCVMPEPSGQVRHLRSPPHRLLGDVLKATAQLLSSHDLRTVEELKQGKPGGWAEPCRPIADLEVYTGYRCCHDGCGYRTRLLSKMRDHVTAHGRKAKEHRASRLWQECRLQTYFTAKGRIDYFVVADDVVEEKEEVKEAKLARDKAAAVPPLTHAEGEFKKLKNDYEDVERDLQKQGRLVQGSGDSRSCWMEVVLANIPDSSIE